MAYNDTLLAYLARWFPSGSENAATEAPATVGPRRMRGRPLPSPTAPEAERSHVTTRGCLGPVL